MALTGIPGTGVKSTFTAISGHVEEGGLASSSSGQGRIVVLKVPDPRLDLISEQYNPRKIVPATVELAEYPGAIGGPSTDARALAKAREADALVLVIRTFESSVAPHLAGSVDGKRDLDLLTSEMVLSDLSIVEGRLDRLSRSVKRKDNEEDLAEQAVLLRLKSSLEEGFPVRDADLTSDEQRRIRSFGFLSEKPVLLILNIGESQIGQEAELVSGFKALGFEVETLCASLEAELAQLEDAERKEFMGDFGLTELAAPKVLAAAYRMMSVRTFFTYGEDECRAWNVKVGDNAVDAAARIHTDLARGFIRAEVFSFEDFREHRELKNIKAAGRFRLEGKEYVVQDGDLIIIRHSS